MDEEERALALNRSLVDSLITKHSIRTPAVEAAFRAVLRHRLFPSVNMADVYKDCVIVVKRAKADDVLPKRQILSFPTMPGLLARVLEHASLMPGMRTLQIGTGPGYLAALMAELVGSAGRVVSIEIDPDVSASAGSNLSSCGYGRVECVVGDGYLGWPSGAPYDRIVATAACADVPVPWIEQLAPGGMVILPLPLSEHASWYPMVAFRRKGSGLRGEVVRGRPVVGFLPLYGPSAANPVLADSVVSRFLAAAGAHTRGVTSDPERAAASMGIRQASSRPLRERGRNVMG